MKNLQEATERICELKGSLIALDALLTALLREMPDVARPGLARELAQLSEVARTVLLHAPVSELTCSSFERDVARFTACVNAVAPGA